LRVENRKPKLILLNQQARITFAFTTQGVGLKQQTRRALGRQIEHYYEQKQKPITMKQKRDKNYTKRKSQPKLQGNKQHRSTLSE
jgi:hypothetical protein